MPSPEKQFRKLFPQMIYWIIFKVKYTVSVPKNSVAVPLSSDVHRALDDSR